MKPLEEINKSCIRCWGKPRFCEHTGCVLYRHHPERFSPKKAIEMYRQKQ